MTPERIAELRRVAEVYDEKRLNECLDYIDTLQRDVATYAKRDELIVGRMMMERDLAREEANNLRAELAALKTPRPCQDCHWFVPEEDDVPNCCGGDALIGVIEDPELPWLCGHFQKKGTP
jgi:hypothetical protein